MSEETAKYWSVKYFPNIFPSYKDNVCLLYKYINIRKQHKEKNHQKFNVQYTEIFSDASLRFTHIHKTQCTYPIYEYI